MSLLGLVSAFCLMTVAWFVGLSYALPPNIVFILTDDQDVRLGGETPVKKTRELIGNAGIQFSNMFVTSPLCCPSRSSILTGKYVHNNGAINNTLSGNCSSASWQRNSEIHAFAPYLKKQGYNTFFAGKYLNQYGHGSKGFRHVPPGWDQWNGLVGNSKYYNYSLSVNGKRERHRDKYPGDYLPEIIGKRAIKFIDSQQKGTPFFAMLSTPSCHGPWTHNTAPKYSSNFSDIKAPRDPAFSYYSQDKHWLIRQVITPMSNATIDQLDYRFRDRWRTLLTVDDIVENVVNLLKKKNILDDTYIFYASDNGFHLGQFGLPNDKRQMYEFDIRVPLMVRGPGIQRKQVRTEPVLNIDLAPTFIDLSGVTPPEFMDGTSLKPLFLSNVTWRNDFLVEHSGEFHKIQSGCPKKSRQQLGECEPYAGCVCEDAKNNTYTCVRWLTSQHNYIYCRFQDNENFEEAYDLNADPHQLKNIAASLTPTIKQHLKERLLHLQSCSGKSCRLDTKFIAR